MTIEENHIVECYIATWSLIKNGPKKRERKCVVIKINYVPMDYINNPKLISSHNWEDLCDH